MSQWSFTVSAFAAAGKGISGQYTGTSFWGQAEGGITVGVASGGGAGIAGMITYSRYLGNGLALPAQYRDVYRRIYGQFIEIGEECE